MRKRSTRSSNWKPITSSVQAETAASRFRIATLLFAAIGVISIVIGVMARVGLSAAVIRPVNQTIRHFQRIAAGDLTIAVKVRSRNEMGQLLGALTQMRDGLVDTVSKVRGSTGAITQGANEIASGNADLSRRTEQQAAALEETAASMEELSATVKQNADNAQQANRLAHGALETVTRGGTVVGRVTETMEGITTSSRKVAEIIGMIEGIAFQTNILALNAAVEAARAGEQGRGFAVVASEVRSLAQRSGTAAKEIKELIGESAAKVEQGASLVAEAGKTMQRSDAVGRACDRHHGRNRSGRARAERGHCAGQQGDYPDRRGHAAQRGAGGRGCRCGEVAGRAGVRVAGGGVGVPA